MKTKTSAHWNPVLFAVSFFLTIFASRASAESCNKGSDLCWATGIKKEASSPAPQPTTDSKLSVNPSAVPVDDAMGGEAIIFQGTPDFVLVKGNGRVGAGVSLTNAEETFFGPPGFELASDYLARSIARQKYQSQKLNLATALAAYTNHEKGMKQFKVNLGLVGRYNKLTHDLWPGAGISVTAAFLSFGYSVSQDEYLVNLSSLGVPQQQKYQYSIETYSFGIYLSNFIIDYSTLHVYAPGAGDFTYSLATGSLLVKDWIFSLSLRNEDSSRPVYDPATQTLVAQRLKQNYFGGIQYAATKHFMVSAFYNYYLFKEISGGVTVFF